MQSIKQIANRCSRNLQLMCSHLRRMLDSQGCSRWPQEVSRGLTVLLTCTGEVPLSIMPFINPA